MRLGVSLLQLGNHKVHGIYWVEDVAVVPVAARGGVLSFAVYPDSLKSREKFLAFRGSGDSDGA